MNFTLKQLQVFRAVAQFENLGKAAETLYMTKGAVSQALHELERQLGVPLFERVHPRIRLNHQGERLLPLADELLHRSQDISLLFTEDAAGRFLEVGASKTIGQYLLPSVLADFERTSLWLPGAHIANSRKICELVGAFALDAALLEGEDHHYPDLVFEPWLQDDMVVVAPKGHPLAQGGPHPPEALRGQRWVLREPNSGTRRAFDDKLAPLVAPYSVALTVSSPGAVLGMVGQGLGLTFTSQLMATGPTFRNQCALVHLQCAFPRELSLCYHRRKHHSISMDQFLAFCRKWRPVDSAAV